MIHLSLKTDFFEEFSLVIEENNVIENKNKNCGILEKKMKMRIKLKIMEYLKKKYN